ETTMFEPTAIACPHVGARANPESPRIPQNSRSPAIVSTAADKTPRRPQSEPIAFPTISTRSPTPGTSPSRLRHLFHDHVVVPQQRPLGFFQVRQRDVVVRDRQRLLPLGLGKLLLQRQLAVDELRRERLVRLFALDDGVQGVGGGE